MTRKGCEFGLLSWASILAILITGCLSSKELKWDPSRAEQDAEFDIENETVKDFLPGDKYDFYGWR